MFIFKINLIRNKPLFEICELRLHCVDSYCQYNKVYYPSIHLAKICHSARTVKDKFWEKIKLKSASAINDKIKQGRWKMIIHKVFRHFFGTLVSSSS